MDRLWEKVEKTDSCWNWAGAINGPEGRGYGVIWFRRRQELAHRLVFELMRGEIPEGLTIDHICRNRRCVRPDHLRAVSNRLNVLAGEGITAENWQKTHCHRGHPFTEENTLRVRTAKNGDQRQCRACNRDRARARYHAKKKANESPS